MERCHDMSMLKRLSFMICLIKIDQNRFIERLNTRIVEIIGRQWDFWYGLTLKYKDEFGNPNAPTSLQDT